MGSRRATTHSSFGNGRSSNGSDVSGSSRSSNCSYLSNVRPENRSTLCSVIAQLTEDTQPSFVTTLKSKAVSENCTVKFSCMVTGHPAPQVTWYKDDKQLDRFCGLPKYEIFRNGQNHSLHIYNCTVEDAAIYQASAINLKGIVSCSGVLEVGEMNEFKIHQRYFAKLKQKAGSRCREPKNKENQENLQTISPDRTQRKRHSTREAFLSTPSPTEEEGSSQAEATVAESGLQEAEVEKPEEKPAPVTDGAASAKTCGQTSKDNVSKSRTYMNDPTQNIFTTHQPKIPVVNKKIKISKSVKVPKADIGGEVCPVKSVSSERTTRKETSSFVALEAVKNRKSEGMEVENDVNSPIVHLDLKFLKTNHETSTTQKSAFVKSSSKDENRTAAESHVPTSPSYTLAENKCKKRQNHGKEGSHKDIEKHLEMKNQSPLITFKQKQSMKSSNLNLKKDIHSTKHVTTMDNDRKSKASSDECSTLSFSESKEKPCDTRTAFPQRPRGVAESLMSEKETSPGQKKRSMSPPAVQRKVTQAHTEMNGNDAPVSFELPPDPCTISSHQLQKTDDIETSPSFAGLQAMLNGSRESNESCPEMFTSQKKTPLEIPGGAENIPGCNVSPAIQQRQVDTAIKTVEGTEIQDVEKVAVSEISALGPSGKILEMETETAAQHVTEQTETGKADDSGNTNSGVGVPSRLEMKMNEPKSATEEKTSSELQKLKSDEFEKKNQTPENTKPPELITDSQKPPTPEQKVISIAELLRSQIKALDLTQTNSVSNSSTHSNLTQSPMIKDPGMSQEVGINNVPSKSEEITFKPDIKTKNCVKDAPPSNLKATLMEIYQQLNETEELTLDVKLAPAEALNESSFSIRDAEKDGRARKYNEAVIEINQKTKPINEVPSKDRSVVSDPGSRHGKDILLLASKDEFTNKSISKQPKTVIPEFPETVMNIKTQEINANILEHNVDESDKGHVVGLLHQRTPEINLNSKTEKGPALSDQNKTEEEDINTHSSEKLQIIHSQSNLSSNKQENGFSFTHQETSEIKESPRSDFIINPTPESSPLLRKRNCISPIPSATAQELASGARRKISTPKSKPEEAEESPEKPAQKNELPVKSSRLSTTPASPSLSQRSPLLQPAGEPSSVVERHSPLVSRRKMASETQTLNQMVAEEIHTEGKPAEKDKHNPFKAPQVIRKIRAETFADASGHLKLWCQFFNVLSDSTIKWYKNEEEIALVKRNAGDEAQVNLAIAQASSIDSGVYGCSITNEYGTDSTDFLLSAEILAGMALREDLGVGEEIEMTPLIFTKGLADSGTWGNKFFGRIMVAESHIGDGCSHKAWRAKVIYGLEPVFESGNLCVIKVRSSVTYGGKEESCLIERNLDIMKKECKIQNLAREYCKIFSAEARVIETFGPSFDVIPVYLMYRPANTIPYATVETDLKGVYKKYSDLDHTGRIDIRTGSEVEQKCSTLQHWIFQWTSGNLLLTRLEADVQRDQLDMVEQLHLDAGVDTKLTNVGISFKSTGYQGLSVEGNPKVFEHFVSQHKCNYFCGLLGLKPLKVMDSLMTPTKPKGSRSPLLQRKKASSSSSPQLSRKTAVSPRLPRKTEQDNISVKEKAADAPKVDNVT